MNHWDIVAAFVLGIPAGGFAVRMVIRSITDGIARIRAAGHPPVQPADPAQGQRLAQLEAEVASLHDEVGRLSAVESFYAQLQAPRAPGGRFPPTGASGPHG